MHLTREHTPMPNATAGRKPARHFLHLCEQSKSLLPGGRWAAGRGVFRGLGQAARTPRVWSCRALRTQFLRITSSVSPPSGVLITVGIISAAVSRGHRTERTRC